MSDTKHTDTSELGRAMATAYERIRAEFPSDSGVAANSFVRRFMADLGIETAVQGFNAVEQALARYRFERRGMPRVDDPIPRGAAYADTRPEPVASPEVAEVLRNIRAPKLADIWRHQLRTLSMLRQWTRDRIAAMLGKETTDDYLKRNQAS